MSLKPQKHKPGVYETDYGNACEYDPDEYGDNNAWDLDMGELIPIEMVDFSKFIREISAWN
jgi:hypothetical protein